MITNIRLPFGLHQDRGLVHVDEVSGGKKCRCVCPSCFAPLIAAKGNLKQHHFKHAVNTSCENGLESAVHLAAKKIIKEKNSLTLPEYILQVSLKDNRGIEHYENEIIVKKGSVISFDNIIEEKLIQNIKVDLLARINNKYLAVEIFYRHKVDDEKSNKIKDIGLSAIEINLSQLKVNDIKNWDSFWLYINNPENIAWLHNVKADIEKDKLKQRLDVKIKEVEKRYIEEDKIFKMKQEKEKKILKKSIAKIEQLSSLESINKIKKLGVSHQAWINAKKYIPFSWDDIPCFLNVNTPNCDWIYGCDRRVWQVSVYSYFILKLGVGALFTTKNVDKWLQNTVGCKVPSEIKSVFTYKNKYPQLIPNRIGESITSSWKTLNIFFRCLCDYGILRYLGPDDSKSGSYLYEVISIKTQKE